MTPMLAELHRAHVGRLQRFRSRAVPDDGIDFKRPPRHVILRDVVAPQSTIKHMPPVMIVSIQREHIPPPKVVKVKVNRPSAFRLNYLARQIVDCVAERFDVMPQQILGSDRHAIFTVPRFVAMYLCKAVLHFSTPMIGRHFGGRNHSTAINALWKTNRRALSDFQFGSELAALECSIRRRNP